MERRELLIAISSSRSINVNTSRGVRWKCKNVDEGNAKRGTTMKRIRDKEGRKEGREVRVAGKGIYEGVGARDGRSDSHQTRVGRTSKGTDFSFAR